MKMEVSVRKSEALPNVINKDESFNSQPSSGGTTLTTSSFSFPPHQNKNSTVKTNRYMSEDSQETHHWIQALTKEKKDSHLNLNSQATEVKTNHMVCC